MNRVIASLFLSGSLFLGSGTGYASDAFQCKVSKKRYCAKDGCKENDGSKEYVIINFDNNTYSMCTIGKEKCDDIILKNVGKSGIFAVVYFGGSSFLKMALQDDPLAFNLKAGDFIEIRDFGLGVMNSYGSCSKQK
jgi:hypothetical protein